MKLIPTPWGRMTIPHWFRYRRACRAHHPREGCAPGRNHPSAAA